MYKIIKKIWDSKIKIAKLQRDYELKKIAHSAAHNIAINHKDNTIIGYPTKLYKMIYKREYNRILKVLTYEGTNNGKITKEAYNKSQSIEGHPNFEGFIRAFWRRIDKYKNDYGPELPEKLPVEFKANMITAAILLKDE